METITAAAAAEEASDDDELYLSAEEEEEEHNEPETSSLKQESQVLDATNASTQSPTHHDDATQSTYWSSWMTIQFPLSALPVSGASELPKSVPNIEKALITSPVRANDYMLACMWRSGEVFVAHFPSQQANSTGNAEPLPMTDWTFLFRLNTSFGSVKTFSLFRRYVVVGDSSGTLAFAHSAHPARVFYEQTNPANKASAVSVRSDCRKQNGCATDGACSAEDDTLCVSSALEYEVLSEIGTNSRIYCRSLNHRPASRAVLPLRKNV
eukprot:gb/GECG01016371.1/.p1 GENE.gb/GECG01016371.1/~~gb/GECG01016371.1/.p1  ORF type:complete len:268 (+),score=40.52 gb/GECG01016371.1/:1-804(+)